MIESYVAIDLETTGLNPKLDKIIEIGAVKVQSGKVIEEYTTLLNPRRDLTLQIIELTGINDDELKQSPDIEAVIKDILDFCGTNPILGHHIIFDYSFLKRAAVNHGFQFNNQGIDTLKLCRKFMPQEHKKTLHHACQFFEIEQKESHRALSDAYAAHFLYQKLVKFYGGDHQEEFAAFPLIYQVKKEQPASKRQKQYLRDLLKYHRIDICAQIDYLSRNEVSRVTDQIISKYGRITKR